MCYRETTHEPCTQLCLIAAQNRLKAEADASGVTEVPSIEDAEELPEAESDSQWLVDFRVGRSVSVGSSPVFVRSGS